MPFEAFVHSCLAFVCLDLSVMVLSRFHDRCLVFENAPMTEMIGMRLSKKNLTITQRKINTPELTAAGFRI